MKYCTRVLTTDNLNDQQRMLNERKLGLTSFELAGLMGVEDGKNANATWLEKIGNHEGIAYPNYFWNLKIRKLIAEEFAKVTKKKIGNGGYYRSEQNKIAQDIIDGLIEQESAGLSCFSIGDIAGWEDEEQIPLKEYIHAQWCMYITGMDLWYLAVLVNESKFFYRVVDRNEESIGNMVKTAEDFWNGNVKLNRPPVVDASQYTEWAIASLFEGGIKEKFFIEDGKYDTLCADIIELRVEMQRLKRVCDAKINKLKMVMQDHDNGATENHYITWSKRPKVLFNKEQFEKDYPSLAKTYTLISFNRPLFIKRYSKNPTAVKARLKADALRKEQK